MTKFSRRQFTAGLAAGTALVAAPSIALGARPRVVVVGGGAGGQPLLVTLQKTARAQLM